MMVFNGYGATTNENQSRLINAAVTGLFLDGDDLTGSSGQQGADYGLTNSLINAMARCGQTFIPADGNTGTGAANLFFHGKGGQLVRRRFSNYTSSATNITVNLAQAGLPAGSYVAFNLWDRSAISVTNSFNVVLNPAQSRLFELLAPGSSAAVISRMSLSGASLINSGNGGIANVPYYVLSTTNQVTGPWLPIATNTFDASGATYASHQCDQTWQPQCILHDETY